MDEAIKITVTGEVQGVYYRASTQAEASRLGLVGWVRNQADGSVELLAQGSSLALSALADWCGQGPPQAVVTQVVSHPCPVDRALTDFLVLHK